MKKPFTLEMDASNCAEVFEPNRFEVFRQSPISKYFSFTEAFGSQVQIPRMASALSSNLELSVEN